MNKTIQKILVIIFVLLLSVNVISAPAEHLAPVFINSQKELPEIYFTDVLVIGGGIAGSAAVEELKTRNKNVIMVMKSDMMISNTSQAQGGIAGAVDENDNPEFHLKDTFIAGGRKYSHDDAVKTRFMIENAPRMINYLWKELGVPFNTLPNGALSLGNEGGHDHHRIARALDQTGAKIQDSFKKAVEKKDNQNAEVKGNIVITRLLVKDNVCYGAEGFNNKTGLKVVFYAKKTLLATGGMGQVYKNTSNPRFATGDGVALAYKAKAKIKDMGFFQFHPTTLIAKDFSNNFFNKIIEVLKPFSPQFITDLISKFFIYLELIDDPMAPRNFLISEATRGEGAQLLSHSGPNGELRRFMFDYDPRGEVATRDIVSRAIWAEMDKTKKPVYIDLRTLHDKATGETDPKKLFPKIYNKCRKNGYDPHKEPIPITPAAHFAMGGVATDIHGQTSIRGLYAAGEVACSGVHGANRLASNSLQDAAFFGWQSAIDMSLSIDKDTDTDFKNKIPKLFVNEPSERIPVRHEKTQSKKRLQAMRQAIEDIMWNKVALIRNEENMNQAEQELKKLEEELSSLKEKSIDYFEVEHLLINALLITEDAISMRYSLGAHFRMDFPNEPEGLFTVEELMGMSA